MTRILSFGGVKIQGKARSIVEWERHFQSEV